MSDTHTDKRSVATDALETLGMIIGESEKRDAIHLAVEPVTAAHTLRPGEDVGFVDGGVGICDNPVGIVDPFLKAMVQRGQRFWLVIYPRQITSLRHVWEHPKFPASLDVTAVAKPLPSAQQWFRDFADKHNITYLDLVRAGQDWVDTEEYYTQHGSESLRDAMCDPDIHAAFWNNWEIITGTKVADERKGEVFSCSC